jgi:hypothetical protein
MFLFQRFQSLGWCPMSPKGGKREGAGKPALYGEPMERVNIMVRKEDTKLLVKLAGSRSAGLRVLCEFERSLTKRALDGGDSAALQALSLLRALATSQAESKPARRK